MPRIPFYDDPFSAKNNTPSARVERTPMDIMVELAAQEVQNILATRYNYVIGQEVASPRQEVPITRPRTTALYKPETFFQGYREEAEELGILPPASSHLLDLLEYQTRASKRRETLPSWWDRARFKNWEI